jgi:hypothetical protein
MRSKRTIHRKAHHRRHGMMTLEVVMTIGVMVPAAGLLFYLGIKMCATAYEAISGMVSWPFL